MGLVKFLEKRISIIGKATGLALSWKDDIEEVKSWPQDVKKRALSRIGDVLTCMQVAGCHDSAGYTGRDICPWWYAFHKCDSCGYMLRHRIYPTYDTVLDDQPLLEFACGHAITRFICEHDYTEDLLQALNEQE